MSTSKTRYRQVSLHFFRALPVLTSEQERQGAEHIPAPATLYLSAIHTMVGREHTARGLKRVATEHKKRLALS
jgi:hypothetical protein